MERGMVPPKVYVCVQGEFGDWRAAGYRTFFMEDSIR